MPYIPTDEHPLPGGGSGTVTNTGTLTDHALIVGNGTVDVSALGSLGTTVTVLHGNASGDPTFGAVVLGSDVSGDLPFANLTQGSALSVLGVTGNATADVASIAAGSDKQVLRRSGTAVAFGAIDLASSAAVTGVLPVANFTTGTPTGAKFVRDDGVLAVPSGGSGDVVGPGSAVDGHLAVFDGTTGKLIKDGGAPGGAAEVLLGSANLTHAQIAALNSTPITVVAAPGAGFTLVPVSFHFLINTTAGAYSNVAVSVIYGGGVGGTLHATLSGFLNSGAHRCSQLPIAATALVNPDNVALVVTAASNPTGGNAANTMKVRVVYVVVPTPA